MMQMRCPSCEQNKLVQGTIESSGKVHFRPVTAKFLSLRTAYVKVRAHMCASCGFIAMVGDTEKLQHISEPEPAKKRARAAK